MKMSAGLFLITMTVWGSISTANLFESRAKAAAKSAKAANTKAALDDFARGNAGYQKVLYAFANRFGGGLAAGSTCNVGTNYRCGDGPCTPYGSSNVAVSQIHTKRGATFECQLILNNGLACLVDRETSMGEFYNYPKKCQQGRVKVWGECYDSANKPYRFCLK